MKKTKYVITTLGLITLILALYTTSSLFSKFDKAGLQYKPGNMLDAGFLYTTERGYRNLDEFTASGRQILLDTAYTLDMCIPIIFSLFLFLLIKELFKVAFGKVGYQCYIVTSLPLFASLFDLMENIFIRKLLHDFSYKSAQGYLPYIRFFTCLKYVFFLLSLIAIAILIFDLIRFRKLGKKNENGKAAIS